MTTPGYDSDITSQQEPATDITPSKEDKARLDSIIRSTKAFQQSEDEPFTLSSGIQSNHYFDIKTLNGDAEGLYTTAQILYGMIHRVGEINSVGGLESGSIPMAAAVSQLSYMLNPTRPITSFYVRKNPKEYGLQKMIEGIPRSPAIILEDVITTGKSALRAISALQEAGYECRGLFSVIFRGEPQHLEMINKRCRFHYIFAESDFIAS